MINVVYRGRGYADISVERLTGEQEANGALLRDVETGAEVFVLFSDPALVLEPTDDAWFSCANVAPLPANTTRPGTNPR